MRHLLILGMVFFAELSALPGALLDGKFWGAASLLAVAAYAAVSLGRINNPGGMPE